jgi:hypothetical protein
MLSLIPGEMVRGSIRAETSETNRIKRVMKQVFLKKV